MNEEKSNHWLNKTIYITGTGEQIVEQQDKINCSENMFTIGTIIIPILSDGSTTGKFHAWISYKVNPKALNKNQEKEKDIKFI